MSCTSAWNCRKNRLAAHAAHAAGELRDWKKMLFFILRKAEGLAQNVFNEHNLQFR